MSIKRNATTRARLSSELCALNIKAFEAVNRDVKRLEATVLFAKLQYIQKKQKQGKTSNAPVLCTRREMAAWLKTTPTQIDSWLRILVQQGMLEKSTVIKKYGGHLSLKLSDAYKPIAVNFRRLFGLVEQVGSLREALIFSKICLLFANASVDREEKRWCLAPRDYLAAWSGLSVQTISIILRELETKHFIRRGYFLRKGKRHLHLRVPSVTLERLFAIDDTLKRPCIEEKKNRNPRTLALCPMNMRAFEAANARIQDLEASVLFAKLTYKQSRSTFREKAGGPVYVVCTRKELGDSLKMSVEKIATLLSHLEAKGAIRKKRGWHEGRSVLLIEPSHELKAIKINFDRLFKLVKETGSMEKALVFSKICFMFSGATVEQCGKRWSPLQRKYLAAWAAVSPRKLDGMLRALRKRGLLLFENFVFQKTRQLHLHVMKTTIDTLFDYLFSLKRIRPKRIVSQKVPLNAGVFKKADKKRPPAAFCSQALDYIGNALTRRQEAYLRGAVARTVQRYALAISCPDELFEELTFSILTPEQRQGVSTFRHTVSRFMKLLAEKKYLTPKGFHRYSNIGRRIKEKIQQREQAWETLKWAGMEDQRRARGLERERALE